MRDPSSDPHYRRPLRPGLTASRDPLLGHWKGGEEWIGEWRKEWTRGCERAWSALSPAAVEKGGERVAAVECGENKKRVCCAAAQTELLPPNVLEQRMEE